MLPFSERRDRSKPSFNVEAKIYRQETGREIPGHCLVDGSADMLNQWCYAVPEPMNAAGPCEEILAMADGRQGCARDL